MRHEKTNVCISQIKTNVCISQTFQCLLVSVCMQVTYQQLRGELKNCAPSRQAALKSASVRFSTPMPQIQERILMPVHAPPVMKQPGWLASRCCLRSRQLRRPGNRQISRQRSRRSPSGSRQRGIKVAAGRERERALQPRQQLFVAQPAAANTLENDQGSKLAAMQHLHPVVIKNAPVSALPRPWLLIAQPAVAEARLRIFREETEGIT